MVSSEALWSVHPDDLCRMLNFAASPAKVVVVFRCLKQSTLSGWHTAVAEGYRSDYAAYVEELVLSGRGKDFNYPYHLGPLRAAADIVVVDFEGPESLITRLVRALGLPEIVFSEAALLARRHVRPSPWFTSLLLRIHRDPAVGTFGPHERASLSQAVRGAAQLITPLDELEALAAVDTALSEEQNQRVAEMCVVNRKAAQEFITEPLAACPCST